MVVGPIDNNGKVKISNTSVDNIQVAAIVVSSVAFAVLSTGVAALSGIGTAFVAIYLGYQAPLYLTIGGANGLLLGLIVSLTRISNNSKKEIQVTDPANPSLIEGSLNPTKEVGQEETEEVIDDGEGESLAVVPASVPSTEGVQGEVGDVTELPADERPLDEAAAAERSDVEQVSGDVPAGVVVSQHDSEKLEEGPAQVAADVQGNDALEGAASSSDAGSADGSKSKKKLKERAAEKAKELSEKAKELSEKAAEKAKELSEKAKNARLKAAARLITFLKDKGSK